MTPAEMCSWLGISLWRLRVWNEAGLFGDTAKRVGKGQEREYTLEDAVRGMVAREVLDLTRSRSLRIVFDVLDRPEESGTLRLISSLHTRLIVDIGRIRRAAEEHVGGKR